MTVVAASEKTARAPKIPLSWIVRLGVSAVVLVVIFRIVPFATVWETLRHISPVLWISALIAFLAGHAAAAFKWRLLIGAGVPFSSAFRAHLAGLGANLCLPGVAGGDVVRAGLVFKEAEDKARLTVGSFADRILDTLGLVLIAAVGGFLALSNSGETTFRDVLIFGALALAAVAIAFSTAFAIDTRFKTSPPVGKLSRLLAKAAAAAAALARQPGRLALCLGISMAVQAGFVAINIALANAAGVEAPASAWFFAWSSAKIIAIAPISLGGLGVREASMAGLMAPFGADKGEVVAIGLVWQTILYASGLIGILAQAAWRPAAKVVPAAASPEITVDTAVTSLAERNGEKPEIVILGAGPAGVGGALMLARSGKAKPVVIERQDRVGGNSSSFQLNDIWVDFGSHRLHPASEPHILEIIQEAVGEDLLWRPRHGRILLKGRWIHFPLKPVDLLLKLPKGFTFALMWDAATKPFRKAAKGEETFASVLRKGLGPAMSENFYYPYVKKLWALEPDALAVTLAHRRVSGSSIGKILMKILRQLPGFKGKRTGGFFYPKKGFGQITEALKTRAEENGAAFELGASVSKIEHKDGRIVAVHWTKDGKTVRSEPHAVWSTLPISMMIRMMDPPAPAHVLEAAANMRFRGMILIYLVLETPQFTEYDAHYFPELSVPISRLSETKNYHDTPEPRDATVICAELPCDPGEPLWEKSDQELGHLLCQWLGDVGLPVTAKVRAAHTRRLGFAYPVYDRNFEDNFRTMDEWIGGFDGLLTYGRQGLFAHDNTHHALAMAHGAVDCLGPDGGFDKAKWASYREVFETHVVED